MNCTFKQEYEPENGWAVHGAEYDHFIVPCKPLDVQSDKNGNSLTQEMMHKPVAPRRKTREVLQIVLMHMKRAMTGLGDSALNEI